MNRFVSISFALVACVGVAAVPGRDNWLYSTAVIAACVFVGGWVVARHENAPRGVRLLYATVLLVAGTGLALTVIDGLPKLLDTSAQMPVSVSIAPASVEAGADVLDAHATLTRDGGPLGWRILWFIEEVLPFLAGITVLLLLWPLAAAADEPFERRNGTLLMLAGTLLVVVPAVLGVVRFALARGSATALEVELGYGAEGTLLLDPAAIGAGIVLAVLGKAVRAASALREFERSVI